MFQEFSLPDFLSIEFDLRYIIDPLLPAEGVGLVHGKGGHGKTQLCFELMRAITTGDEFLRKYAVVEGNVLYLQFDMSQPQFQERLEKAVACFDHPERVIVVPHGRVVNSCELAVQHAIRELVDRYEPVLVVVDTLRKIHPYDENDNSVPSVVYTAWRDACAPAGVLILHHDRKSGGDDPKDDSDDPVESFRGARAWIDDCDLGIWCKKYGKKPKIKMDFSKLRCKPQDMMHLWMNQETLLVEPKGPETVREWLEHLHNADPSLTRTELVRETAARSGKSERAAYGVLKVLEGNEKIVVP